MHSYTLKRLLSQIISERFTVQDLAAFSAGDWARTLRQAQREAVTPLLYWRLSASGQFLSLPVAVQKALREAYARTWAQNQKIFAELSNLTDLFHQAGIPAVVLKGACFALTLYPDPGLRSMGDLDLLVPAALQPGAVELVQSMGYQSLLPEASPGLHELFNHAVCLHKPGEQSFPLEIHRSLVGDRVFTYSVSMDWFWEQTEPFRPRSGKNRFEHLQMLSPEAQILYAVSHTMLQHGGSSTSLRWHYDLDQLVRCYADRLDWDLLLAQAQTFSWSSALDAALVEVRNLFDTPIREDVRRSLCRETDRLASLVKRKQTPPTTHIIQEQRKLLSLNWYGRLRLVAALLFPRPAYMRWRYKRDGRWMLPLSYLTRWKEILRDGLRTLTFLMQSNTQGDER